MAMAFAAAPRHPLACALFALVLLCGLSCSAWGATFQLPLPAAARSAADSEPSQWHQCTVVPIIPGPQDTTLCVTLTFTDCDMHVVLEAQTGGNSVPLLDTTLSNVELDDPELAWCRDIALGCTICVKFAQVTIDSDEVASGCVVVTSTCAEKDYPIGCFSDIPRIDVCSVPCPNDCSGNGVCNFDGTCECKDGYEGDDCAAGCDPTKTGTEMALGELYLSQETDKHGVWEGYVEVLDGGSEVSLAMTIDSHAEYDVSVKRGCRPDEDDYDQRFSLDGSSHEHITRLVTYECPEDAGTLFFSLVCKKHAPCTFDIQVLQTRLGSLEMGETLTGQHTRSSLIYSFTVEKNTPFTVQVTSTTPYGELTLLPGYCPNRDIFLASATDPSVSFAADGNPEELRHVMIVEERKPDPGQWFVRYDACASAGSCVDASFSVVVSQATCDAACEDGFCASTNHCQCNSDDASVYARPKVCGFGAASSGAGMQTISRSVSVSDCTDCDGLGTAMYVIIGGVAMALILLAAAVVIGVALWKKRRPPPTLYNMLSETDDMF